MQRTFIVGALALLGLGACAGSEAASPSPSAPAPVVTTAPAFDPQAYCVEKLRVLAERYPTVWAQADPGSTVESGCVEMLAKRPATTAEAIDSLMTETEGYYQTAEAMLAMGATVAGSEG